VFHQRVHRLHLGEQQVRVQLGDRRAHRGRVFGRIARCVNRPKAGGAMAHETVREIDLFAARHGRRRIALARHHADQISAMPSTPASRTSPNPYTSWLDLDDRIIVIRRHPAGAHIRDAQFAGGGVAVRRLLSADNCRGHFEQRAPASRQPPPAAAWCGASTAPRHQRMLRAASYSGITLTLFNSACSVPAAIRAPGGR